MRERPILFSGAMVRAILDGKKTQTRRIVMRGSTMPSSCPYGVPGDRLWVRETWHQCPHCDRTVAYRAGGWMIPPSGAPDDGGDRSDRDDRPLGPKCAAHGWRPSIFLPRWASRISLRVTDVRVQRVRDISGIDIVHEGVVERAHDDPNLGRCPVSALDGKLYPDLTSLWRAGWNSINGKRAPWESNPWVWAVRFERVQP